ncbi:hypothetical protein ACIA5C_42095 [Actinoplanes sp. NPDC051343]|jgi:hypothetical protein|uniref:hypothetical protein n=1 Tax=Actinoplanes sp. NPDC051343 TaxID=3363906 RepID=UPI00378ECD31
MVKTIDNDLVADVAREVIRDVAPGELLFFSASAKAYFTGRRRSGGLDYGGQESVELLTAVVLPVVTGMLGDLAADGTKHTAKATVAKLRALFRVGPAQREPIVLDAAALDALHERIEQEGLRLKISKAKARAIADAVIALTAKDPR